MIKAPDKQMLSIFRWYRTPLGAGSQLHEQRQSLGFPVELESPSQKAAEQDRVSPSCSGAVKNGL